MEQEKELVRRAQKDPEAFGVIFDIHYDRIYRYAMRRTGDREIAEDITASTFYKAMSGLWRFVWRDVSLSSWIYKIATNEIRKHYRLTRRTVSLEGFDEAARLLFSDLFEEVLEKEALRDEAKVSRALMRSLERLSLKYQEALFLKYVEGKKIREISTILGKREGTVKSLLSRGIRLLKISADLDSVQPNMCKGIIESEG